MEIYIIPCRKQFFVWFFNKISFIYRLIELMLRLKHVFRYFILNFPLIFYYFYEGRGLTLRIQFSLLKVLG
jgi:hypothetical protein